ncbi:hypothetical protein [Phaffia rhodozyma]|uniref:Uncharacterized protein n=1 Tax=Phaffia rhodozyma TaxID=264483 RepID=A0A0F7SJB1_PHARH|nr:hypothetical protein [Phaffia rhodozyma]
MASAHPMASLFEVHSVLYGGIGDDSHLTHIPSSEEIRLAVERYYELDAVYENPILSFYSKPSITDAFLLSRFVSSFRGPALSVLYPTTWARGTINMIKSIWGSQENKNSQSEHGWKVVSVWSEIGDVTESESFDGFHVGILDHTLHISILPSLFPLRIFGHSPPLSDTNSSDSSPHPEVLSVTEVLPHFAGPGNKSLLHINLRIVTIFQFNDNGLISYHRDHWDVRDLIEGIIPFSGLAGSIGRYLGGLALRGLGTLAGGCGEGVRGPRPAPTALKTGEDPDETTPVNTSPSKEERSEGFPAFGESSVIPSTFSSSPTTPIIYMRPLSSVSSRSSGHHHRTHSKSWGSGSSIHLFSPIRSAQPLFNPSDSPIGALGLMGQGSRGSWQQTGGLEMAPDHDN